MTRGGEAEPAGVLRPGGDLSGLYAAIVASSEDAVVGLSPDGTVVSWNPAAEQLFGYTAAEAVGGSVLVTVDEDREAELRDLLARIAQGEHVRHYETVRVRKDGARVPVSISLSPIHGPGGGVIGASKITRDVSERRSAEDRFRESESRLRALTDNLPDGAIYQVVRDPDGRTRFTFLSAGIERLFGVTPGEAVADPGTLYGTVHEADRERFLAAEAESLRTLSRFDCEFRHTMPDGEVRWAHARSAPRRTPEGDVIWEGVLTDATDRKRAEEAVRASERRLQRLFEANLVGVGVSDRDGGWVEANDELLRVLGYDREELRAGKVRWRDMTPERYLPLDERAMAEASERGACRPYEKEYVRKDGSLVPVLLGYATLDEPGRFVCFVLDLSEPRRVSAELSRSEERFRGLMDQAPFSVQILSGDGRTVRVNRAWEELWGLRLDQLAGYNVLEDPQLETKGVAPGLRQAFAGEPARLPEIAYDPEETLPGRTRNEEPVRWISAVAYPIKDAAGAVREVALVHEDITARRKAEAGLRESERRLRATLESITDAFFSLGRDWRFTYVNRRAGELLGRTDLVGKELWVEFPEAPGSDFETHYRRAMGEGVAISFEAYYPSHERWYDVNAYPSADGLSVYFRDASERRRAAEERERLLAEAEAERERLKAVVENVPVGVILAEAPSGRLVLGNRQLERMFRHPFLASPDVPSYSDWVAYHADGRRVEGREWPLARALGGEVVRGEEFLYERGDGTRFWIRVSAAPVSDARDGIAGAVVAIVDVDAERRAEELLRESEQRSRSILESITDAFYAVGPDWRFTYLNHEAERLLGRSREDLVGKHIWEEFAPAVETAFYEAYHRAMAGTETVRFEVFYPPHEKWYEVHAYPSPDGIAVYFRDITERREIEAALRESEGRLRAIFEQTAAGIAQVDPTGRFTLVNARYCEIVGRTDEELLGGLRMQDVTHPDDLPGNLELLGRLVEHGTPFRVEKRYVRPDGTAVWVGNSVSGVRDGEGRLTGVVAASVDVTDRRRAEEATRRLAGQFRTLAAASATINSSLSKESVLRVVTEEARRVIGAHQAVSSLSENERWAQAINTVSLSDKYRDWRDYAAEPDGSGIYSLVCRTNAAMRLTQDELVSHPAWKGFGGDNGHPPMRGWLAAPLVGRDGRNLGLIQLSDKEDGDFTAEDEAILVQLAQTASVAVENARLYDELREADRRKDEFLAMLAHELRNPLAPIKSGLDLLRLEFGESEVVEVMSEQVGHVVRLVDDLLDVSRILRGKVELKKGPTDVAAVARRAAEAVRPRAEAHRQRLVVSVPEEPLRLEADPVRLTQVVTNLLHNASKYTDDGEEIRLSVSREGGEAVVTVADTGIGIAAELLSRVFDLFTQADQALDRSQGGLGIGLTVVKSLVEMHGGRVAAASEGAGRGSTFTVRLPIVEPSAEAARADAGPDGGRRRVLVVDDNVPAATLLGRLLGKLGGHEVRLAHDGAAAVAEAESFRPDLILLDIGLPKMDGYEVARRLRGRPELDGALLVALTGYGTAEDRRRSLEAGFDDHLVKPPDVEMLRRVLAHPKMAG